MVPESYCAFPRSCSLLMRMRINGRTLTLPRTMDRAGEASRNPVRPGVVLATIPVSPVTAPHGSSDNVRPRVTVSALPTSSSVVRCICLHVF